MSHQTPIPANPPDELIRDILGSMKHVAVVGFSANENRASHGVAKFLLGQGVKLTGVNPGLAGQCVAGIPVVASLAAAGPDIDIVDVFRKPEAVPAIVTAAIAAGARTVWLQEGIVHAEAAAAARQAGLNCIQDRCLYQEWLRLMNESR